MLIRKEGETKWREPVITKYADEKALETVLGQSPEIIPGTYPGSVAVARQLQVPGVGLADLVAIDQAGGITIVECKLEENPEIRRWVIGQVFAYAAGIGEMAYDELDSAWARRTGSPITASFHGASTLGWDSGTFVTSVTENLAAGRFRLVIAVDTMTSELKRTITYINRHSQGDFQLLGLELRYVADAGVEILTPALYGEESAAASQATRQQRSQREWDEASFFEELDRVSSSSAAAIARRLLEWALAHGMTVVWGTGAKTGSMNLRLPGASFAFHQITTDGKCLLSWGFPPSVSESRGEALRQEHLERLNQIPGISLPLDRQWPSFALRDLEDLTGFRAFCDALQGMLAEVALTTAQGPEPPDRC